MLACSSHENYPHTNTGLYIHTYTHHMCMHAYTHTYIFIHKLIHTQTYMHTDSELGELCGGKPSMGAFTKNVSRYNSRWTGPAVAASVAPLQLTLFLEWTVYPGTPSGQWGWKDISTTTGPGFPRKIAFEHWLSSVGVQSLMFPVVPVKRGVRADDRERERERKKNEQRPRERWRARLNDEVRATMRVLIHRGNVVWVCFSPSPPQVMEGTMKSLRSKPLWDTAWSEHWWEAPGQGMHLHATVLTIVIQKRGAPHRKCRFQSMQPGRGKEVEGVWGRKGFIIPTDDTKNRGDKWRSGLPNARSRRLTWITCPSPLWQEESCHVPENCRWVFYILRPALRSPFFF